MFYMDDKIITYPNKTIIEDLLTRDSFVGKNAFTPYLGMRHLIKKQLGKDTIVTAEDILSDSIEFDPGKARANDDGVDRDESAYEVRDGNYYTTLEKIPEEFVERYITQQIIGYKLHNKGLNKLKYETCVAELIVDEEEGDFIDGTDLVTVEMDYSTEDIINAEHELPFILKLLHKGSKEKGASLLSFIIVYEEWKAKREGKDDMCIKPRDLYGSGKIYEMHSTGELGAPFTAQANTTEKFAMLKRWLFGQIPNDPYYKAYKRLMTVLTILDIDITKEDARMYTNSVMDKMLCTFIQSNSEHIEQFGEGDPRIVELLRKDNLFSIIKRINDETFDGSMGSRFEKADYIMTNLSGVLENVSVFRVNRPKEVNHFLDYYSRTVRALSKSSRDTLLSKYEIRNSILYGKASARPLILNIKNLTLYGEVALYGILSLSGNIIALDDYVDNRIRYISIESAIDVYSKKRLTNEWKVAYL